MTGFSSWRTAANTDGSRPPRPTNNRTFYVSAFKNLNDAASKRKKTHTHKVIQTRQTDRDVSSDLQQPEPPPYDAHELSSGSVHFLFAVLRCGIIVFPLRFVISTVIQLSDAYSSHIYLAVLFPHNCYPIYSLTL